jgi:hypothetical protein
MMRTGRSCAAEMLHRRDLRWDESEMTKKLRHPSNLVDHVPIETKAVPSA